MSGLLQELQQFLHSPAGQPLCLYGDCAYPLKVHLQVPYQSAQLTAAQREFNSFMSAIRVAVEWVFGDILTYFAFMDYRKKLKIGLLEKCILYVVC